MPCPDSVYTCLSTRWAAECWVSAPLTPPGRWQLKELGLYLNTGPLRSESHLCDLLAV